MELVFHLAFEPKYLKLKLPCNYYISRKESPICGRLSLSLSLETSPLAHRDSLLI